MIKTQDVTLKVDETITISDKIELRCSREGAVVVRTNRGELEVPRFVEKRFNSEEGRLVPTCEMVLWRDTVLLVGLLSIVIAGPGVLLKCDLCRASGEDTGFYKTDWVDEGGRLFCIYESGVIAWNDAGKMLWHARKHWDDTFLGIEPNALIFIMSDGKRAIIDQSDGSKKSIPDTSS